jgi:hypothetical protein
MMIEKFAFFRVARRTDVTQQPSYSGLSAEYVHIRNRLTDNKKRFVYCFLVFGTGLINGRGLSIHDAKYVPCNELIA